LTVFPFCYLDAGLSKISQQATGIAGRFWGGGFPKYHGCFMSFMFPGHSGICLNHGPLAVPLPFCEISAHSVPLGDLGRLKRLVSSKKPLKSHSFLWSWQRKE